MKETNRLRFGVTVAALIGIASVLPPPSLAQWENVKNPNIPRTAGGKPNLAAPTPRAPNGKPDLSGIWWLPSTGPANTGVPPKYLNNIAADLKPEEVPLQPWAAALFKQHYDVRPEGNWEGHTILNRSARPLLVDAETEERLAKARAKLLERRTGRIRPGFDDKVLADWNGLMIAAFARLGALFGEGTWLEAAGSAFYFIRKEMTVEGRLRHSWRMGQARHPATLDDYANMSRAALALSEATGDKSYIEAAKEWVAILDANYWDTAGGGYFFTAADTRDVMRHTIEKMGLPVAEAANGRAALTWIGDHPAPSMILLDLMMPEMDGFEFLDVLASQAEWRGIPVIVITAKQLTAVEHDRLLRQVHTVIEKATASKIDIAAAISDALRRQPARR